MAEKIMVTGGTGYVGSWVVKKLLEEGYTVKLTTRDKTRKSKFKHLKQIADQTSGSLEIWEADLLENQSFRKPAEGCSSIVHMASPFTLRFNDAEEELVRPALTGTQNVLNAASQTETVKKVVLTSSVAAVYGDNIDMTEQGLAEFTEDDFNTTSSVDHQPYSYSKTVAEKEAWKMYEGQNRWDLVVVNPSFVMGPPLNDVSSSESIQFMHDMLSGKYYLGAPDLEFGFVDVRDVAAGHILALENNRAEGRYIFSKETMSVYELAGLVKQEFGNKYKLPIMKAPKFVLYATGWMFGLTLKFVKRNVGYPLKLNAAKSRQKLKLGYRPLRETVRDMVSQMEKMDLA